MHHIRRIVVPTDFSECAFEAATYAAGLADQLGASITLLHVYMPPTYAFPDGSAYIPTPGALAEQIEQAQKQLEALRARLDRPNVALSLHSANGAIPETISDLARADHADLIVIGTHGRKGLTRLLLGSVAEGVLRRASCPVVTVRGGEVPEVSHPPTATQ